MAVSHRDTAPDEATRGPIFVGISIALLIVSIFVTVIRFFLERKRRSSFQLQDAFILLTVISIILQTVFGNLAIKNGFGHHKDAIAETGGNLPRALLYYWLFQLVYKLSLCFAKLSILALYSRIFTIKSRMKILVWVSFIVISLGGVAFIFVTIFQCIPVSKAWNKKEPGHCVDNTSFRWSWAGFDISTDLWIWLLPIPSFFKLKQSVFQRLGLIGVFLLGLFTCIASIFRMYGIQKSTTSHDITWGAIDAFIWSDAEAKTALICVCLPAFKNVLCGWIGEKETTAYSRSTGRSQRGTSNTFALSHVEVRPNKADGTYSGGACRTDDALGGDDESERYILQKSHDGIQVTHHWTVDSEEGDSTDLGKVPKSQI